MAEFQTTQLGPAEEAKYRSWLEQIGMTPDQGFNIDESFSGLDYDLRGFFKKYGPARVNVAGGQHFTDEFKLPNHETFSNESRYAKGEFAKYAGRWQGETYLPSKDRYQAMSTYEVTGPDGAVYEIEGPKGADPSAILAQIGGQSETPPTEQPGVLEQAARQAGLGTRGVIEGLSSLAALPSDALFGLVNFIQAQRGEPMPFKLASESISNELTAAGLPEPQNGAERFATGVVRSLSSAGTAIGVGKILASPMADAITRGVGEALATRPGVQAGGAVTGTAAAQTAAALGAPVPVQIAAGVVGGAASGAVRAPVSASARGAGALASPLTESGRRAIAGRALSTAASDADAAASRIAQASELVPGSQPTTGQVARDPGLAFFETRLRALGDKRFGARISEQNAARQALLDSIADGGLPERIATRVAERERVTSAMRDQAFKQAQGRRVQTEEIISRIDALRADPENAGRSVQQALNIVRQQLIGADDQLITDARALYAVRKEINRILEGRYVGSDESVMRYAGGQLKEVRGAIDDAITEVAPSWKPYLTKYAQLSRPIERAEKVQTIRQRTALAAPDIATGRDFISQPKWRQVVTNSWPDLSKTMTKGQLKKLQRIGEDLDRGAAATAANRLPGSDTAANLVVSGQISVANILARALGTPAKNLPPALATATRPLSFLYKLPDESIRELLVDAMLDPKLAEQLLKEGSIANVRRFADEFSQSARASTVGAESALAGQETQ